MGGWRGAVRGRTSLVRSAAALAPSEAGDELQLVCANGHRTAHSLARVQRLNDGWCGKCGAGISYTALPEDAPAGISRNERR